ncbi:hypothetical protein AWW66_03255 [Micromonospora rosaria]|uniref:Uncharacterized protein n=1 Tax=Micromonospora rosaria TaxID=47874 RepID=A0A136PYJ1_9ACTN|nr:hypothetical protein [Micromonospora rosaria]KXK63344.1 hypothetical protein AWW66_03255 [Micromonospora rosaria]
MTRAPANLLAVRSLLLEHLNTEPTRVRDDDLEPAEVGIVGDSAHDGGYHCGADRVRRVGSEIRDYSVVESTRDRNGLTTAASALDVGWFSVRSGGRTHDLRSFSVWCISQCAAGTADTRDIREIIYSPDGKTVRRWDRLGRRSTGDSSHRWHTHFSFFRDATKAGRDQTPLFRRYLTTIGLLKAPNSGENVMNSAQEKKLDEALALLRGMPKAVIEGDFVPAARPPHANADYEKNPLWRLGYGIQTGVEGTRAVLAALAALRVELAQESGRSAEQIVAGVLAGLSPEAIAAAIPVDLAGRVVDELSRRIQA